MKHTLPAILLLAFTTVNAQLQEYFFANTFNGTNSAPALSELLSCGAAAGSFGTDSIKTTDGLCSVSTAFCFNAGGGLNYANSTITGSYTINLFFKFNTLGSWSRIIDFSNSTADAGIYLLSNCLNFYPNGNVGTCPYFQPGIYYLFTFVRDGSTNVISVYVNGTLFSTYTDATGTYKPASATTPIKFFRDDNVVTCEDKAGCIKYASVSSQVLTAAEVDSIWVHICSISLPPCAATINYAGNPYSTALSGAQSVTLTGATDGVFSASPGGLIIDASTGNITPSTSTPGVYTVTYTVSDTGVCSSYSTTASVTIVSPTTQSCDPQGNLIVFTNYDGGILNINVDVDIPHLKIGVVSYENCLINFSGHYATNVDKVIYAGFEGTNNNCNLASPIDTVVIHGLAPGRGEINRYPTAGLSNANGYPLVICAYSCDASTYQGGCNTIDQVLDYFNTNLGGTLYSLNAQYCCWLNSNTYNVSALAGHCCVSSTGTATISYSGSPFCSSLATPQAVTLSGTAGGSFSSTTGLTIDVATGAIKPATSTPGTYTVTYSLPGCPGFTTTTTVTIGNTVAAPTASANQSFCTAAAVDSLVATGSNIQWYASAAGGPVLAGSAPLTDGTHYYASQTVGGCESGRTDVLVSLNTLASPNVASNSPVCVGDTLKITAAAVNGGTYTWSGPHNLTGQNITEPNATTADAGDYTLIVNVGNCSTNAIIVHVTVNPLPVAGSPTVNPDTICTTDSALICAGHFSAYAWNTGDTTACIYAHEAGNYYLTVTDVNGCKAESNHVTLNTYEVQAVSISVSGDTLTAHGAIAYQWIFNSAEIPNATGAVYVATQTGLYSVRLTYANGCSAVSNGTLISVTGIATVDNNGFEIYPNPANEYIVVVGNNLANIEVTDVTGKVVLQIPKPTAQQTETIDIKHLAAGLYLLRANGIVKKFVKQ